MNDNKDLKYKLGKQRIANLKLMSEKQKLINQNLKLVKDSLALVETLKILVEYIDKLKKHE